MPVFGLVIGMDNPDRAAGVVRSQADAQEADRLRRRASGSDLETLPAQSLTKFL
jgi:hypothetical protein